MQNGNAQNVTELDFRKKFISGRKCRKYAGKTGFWAFSRDFIISFFWFFAQRCVLIIKHCSSVNKIDLCNWNFLKVAGTADFCRNNDISWVSQAVLYIFSWNFAHWFHHLFFLQIRNAQTWQSLIFKKHFFPAKNAGNMPEIVVFCWILSDSSLYIYLFFFHTKTLFITMPTIKHGSIVNKTDFCSRNFLKVARTADFLTEPVFEKLIFPVDNAGNMPENPGFFANFSSFHH